MEIVQRTFIYLFNLSTIINKNKTMKASYKTGMKIVQYTVI